VITCVDVGQNGNEFQRMHLNLSSWSVTFVQRNAYVGQL